jgi:hypothetical protein
LENTKEDVSGSKSKKVAQPKKQKSNLKLSGNVKPIPNAENQSVLLSSQ